MAQTPSKPLHPESQAETPSHSEGDHGGVDSDHNPKLVDGLDRAELESPLELDSIKSNLGHPKALSKFGKFKNWNKKLFSKVGHLFSAILSMAKNVLLRLLREVPKKVKGVALFALGKFKSLIKLFSSWSLKRKILFAFTFVTLFTVSVFYLKIVLKKTLYHERFHFVGSIAEMSDYAFYFQENTAMEPFYNSPRFKAYLFQMKPVAVNLKRKDTLRDNPMGYFEFVFEGNSGDVVVEMKARESELVDLMERVIENHRYEDLETGQGKNELKSDIQREFNSRLTEGVVRRVEFKNIFIKP